MNMPFLKSILAIALLNVGVISANAQSDDSSSSPKKPEKKIIIREKKDGGNDKETLIILEGDSIIVNGKSIMGRSYYPGVSPYISMNPQITSITRYNSAYLGVLTKKVTNGGLEITNITKGSPAEKAGLKQGDVITVLNKEKLSEPADLYKAVGTHKSGDTISITYSRKGVEQKTTAILDKNDPLVLRADQFNFNLPENYQITGRYFDQMRRVQIGMQVQDTEDSGVKVLDVKDESPASKAGLKKDDIIVKMNDKTISSVEDIQRLIIPAKEGDNFTVEYFRNNQRQATEIKIPKKLKTATL